MFLHKAADQQQLSCLRIRKGCGWGGQCSPCKVTQSTLGHGFRAQEQTKAAPRPHPDSQAALRAGFNRPWLSC